MNYVCPKCRKVIGFEDRRKNLPELIARNGSRVLVRPNEAPRVSCRCGGILIIAKGSL